MMMILPHGNASSQTAPVAAPQKATKSDTVAFSDDEDVTDESMRDILHRLLVT